MNIPLIYFNIENKYHFNFYFYSTNWNYSVTNIFHTKSITYRTIYKNIIYFFGGLKLSLLLILMMVDDFFLLDDDGRL